VAPVSDPDLLNLLIVLLVGGLRRSMPSRLVARNWRSRGRCSCRQRVGRERAAQAIYDAVWLRIEGRFGQALKQATAAYEAGESRGLAALLAARAAHSLRDETRYRYWLGSRPEGERRCAWSA
jgi:HemY protein